MNQYQSEINLLVSPILGKAMINLPLRPDDAKSGSQLGKEAINLLDQKRDDFFIREVLAGNIPDCVRDLVAITISSQGNTLQYYISGDVLSVGNNEDYLRISLNGKSAKRLLDEMNCSLPTKKMCDQIWKSADLKLNPQPMGASSSMGNTQTLINHNTAINNQIAGREFEVLTGHKKDIVLHPHLLQDRSRLAIYGFFYLNGKPIQGPGVQATGHDWHWVDYSQGIRIISRSVILNNQSVDLYNVLNNSQYNYLISEEGNYDASTIYT